jgi:hypothetical protein
VAARQGKEKERGRGWVAERRGKARGRGRGWAAGTEKGRERAVGRQGWERGSRAEGWETVTAWASAASWSLGSWG